MPRGVYKRTKPGWSKGLTKETDPRVAAISAGKIGVPQSPEHCAANRAAQKISQSRLEVRTKISAAMKKYHAEHPGVHIGKNGPNWQGGVGKLPYDQEFDEKFKESIRARDKVCQLCGKTKEQEIEKIGCKLSVHHCKYGKVTKDDIFVTLCRSCNKKVDKKSERDYWAKFFVARMILAA